LISASREAIRSYTSLVKLRVLGGCGAWPEAGSACSGYLLEHAGSTLLIDPGYAVVPRLLEAMGAEAIDAVLVTHGHPDHCADVSPLLRARTLRDDPLPPLPVHCLPGALDRVLALDRPGLLDDAYSLDQFEAGDTFTVGPFRVETRSLPHFVPNAGLRLSADGQSVTYTGDCGQTDELLELAEGTDVFLAEASYPDEVPEDSAGRLSSAREVAGTARRASVGRLVLTHLLPGSSPQEATDAARDGFDGPIAVARPGIVVDHDADV
jgi:ribonuclease BN (tRNA processing enzyme)